MKIGSGLAFAAGVALGAVGVLAGVAFTNDTTIDVQLKALPDDDKQVKRQSAQRTDTASPTKGNGKTEEVQKLVPEKATTETPVHNEMDAPVSSAEFVTDAATATEASTTEDVGPESLTATETELEQRLRSHFLVSANEAAFLRERLTEYRLGQEILERLDQATTQELIDLAVKHRFDLTDKLKDAKFLAKRFDTTGAIIIEVPDTDETPFKIDTKEWPEHVDLRLGKGNYQITSNRRITTTKLSVTGKGSKLTTLERVSTNGYSPLRSITLRSLTSPKMNGMFNIGAPSELFLEDVVLENLYHGPFSLDEPTVILMRNCTIRDTEKEAGRGGLFVIRCFAPVFARIENCRFENLRALLSAEGKAHDATTQIILHECVFRHCPIVETYSFKSGAATSPQIEFASGTYYYNAEYRKHAEDRGETERGLEGVTFGPYVTQLPNE